MSVYETRCRFIWLMWPYSLQSCIEFMPTLSLRDHTRIVRSVHPWLFSRIHDFARYCYRLSRTSFLSLGTPTLRSKMIGNLWGRCSAGRHYYKLSSSRCLRWSAESADTTENLQPSVAREISSFSTLKNSGVRLLEHRYSTAGTLKSSKIVSAPYYDRDVY